MDLGMSQQRILLVLLLHDNVNYYFSGLKATKKLQMPASV
jgi:hypothetical protein